MQNIETINKLVRLNELAKKDAQRYSRKRYIYYKIIKKSGRPFVGISGLRGVGKTVILRQILVEKKNSFYISMDAFEERGLFDLILYLHENYNFNIFLFDEIHYYPRWQSELKKIYDFLPVKIYFTSSVSMDILKSAWDLSRRVQVISIYPFSFAEYLEFFLNKKPQLLSWDELFTKKIDISSLLALEPHFESYLKFPLPVFLEAKSFTLIENIVERILTNDLVYVLKLGGEDIVMLKRLLKFLGSATTEGISYSSIANNLKINKYKVIKFVELLEKAFLLNQVFPAGKNVLKEPKILFTLPFRFLYNKLPQEQLIGALKEEFCVEALARIEKKPYYLKSKRGRKTPDFLVDLFKNIIIEVGGSGKSFRKFKGIDDKYQKFIFAYPTKHPLRKNVLPLILLGLLV